MYYTNGDDADYVDENNADERRESVGASYNGGRHRQAAIRRGSAVTRAQHCAAASEATAMHPAPHTDLVAGPAGYHSGPMDHLPFCQRCFLRRQSHPNHVCVLMQGHRACQWCAQVHQRCIQVPQEFNSLVQTALGLSGVAQAQAIADIQQRIRMRTRRLNQEAREGAAANGLRKRKRSSLCPRVSPWPRECDRPVFDFDR